MCRQIVDSTAEEIFPSALIDLTLKKIAVTGAILKKNKKEKPLLVELLQCQLLNKWTQEVEDRKIRKRTRTERINPKKMVDKEEPIVKKVKTMKDEKRAKKEVSKLVMEWMDTFRELMKEVPEKMRQLSL